MLAVLLKHCVKCTSSKIKHLMGLGSWYIHLVLAACFIILWHFLYHLLAPVSYVSQTGLYWISSKDTCIWVKLTFYFFFTKISFIFYRDPIWRLSLPYLDDLHIRLLDLLPRQPLYNKVEGEPWDQNQGRDQVYISLNTHTRNFGLYDNN